MSYCVNTHHVVFRTYNGQCTIPEESKRMMFKYIRIMCKELNWFVDSINGCRNHIHILVNLPGSVAPAQFAQKVKPAVTKAFTNHVLFPNFRGWGEGYASFSIGPSDLERIRKYIANQEEHHLHLKLREEVLKLMEEAGLEPDEYFDRQFPETDEA